MTNTKLPIMEIFSETFTLVKNNTSSLIKASLSYIIVVLIMESYRLSYVDIESSNFNMPMFMFLALSIFTFTLLSVKFHRIFLLDDVDSPLYTKWSSRESKFLGRWLLIILCILGLTVPLFILLGVSGYLLLSNEQEPNIELIETFSTVFFIPFYYFLSRFSLVLPAIAINKSETSIKWAWKLSKGNSFRLFFILSLLPILLEVINFTFPNSGSLAYSFGMLIFGIIILPFEIGFLSLSYKFLLESNKQNENIENKNILVDENFNDKIPNYQPSEINKND